MGRYLKTSVRSSSDQDSFVDRSIAGLAQDGKIVPVRLALYAEMVKGKPWTPATLREVGGTEGIGLAFLEETFSAATAAPQHRIHQKAAQAVLKALLPETGTDIKGQMRSRQELLEASGYASRPGDFDALIHILDPELRLITPTDAGGKDGGRRTEGGGRTSEEQASQAGAGDSSEPVPSSALRPPPSVLPHYQLTHDYLVHSLRDWLTPQAEGVKARPGRAAAGRSCRSLEQPAGEPATAVTVAMAPYPVLDRQKNWTTPQRKMMHKADWYHVVRGMTLFCCLLCFG